MIYKIYSVYDSAQESYGNPFFSYNDKVAIRDFKIGMSKVDPMMKSDFSLYYLGTWDNFKSEFKLIDKPKLLCVEGDVNE